MQLAAGGAGKIGEKFEKGGLDIYTLEEYIDGISKWVGFSM